MRCLINKKYSFLEPDIRQIPSHGYRVEKVFCNRRNTVELVCFQGNYYVVKQYKRPTLANCFVYTWLRKPKTQRAYRNALILQERGILTAEPVAFIEHYKFGFFHTGWFISTYLPYKNVRDTFDDITDKYERRRFAIAFVEFTNRLFKKNIINQDFNHSNILTYKDGNIYRFALIDINRLKLGWHSTYDETKALTQLRLNPAETKEVLSVYARLSQKKLWLVTALYHLNQIISHGKSRVKHWLKDKLNILLSLQTINFNTMKARKALHFYKTI